MILHQLSWLNDWWISSVVCYMTTCLMFCFSWTLLHFRFNQSWTVWIGCMNLNCLLNVHILSVAQYTITCIDRSVMHVYIRCVSMCMGGQATGPSTNSMIKRGGGSTSRGCLARHSGPIQPRKKNRALLSNESWLVNRDRHNGLS